MKTRLKYFTASMAFFLLYFVAESRLLQVVFTAVGAALFVAIPFLRDKDDS
jgi:hypothetical protein